MKKAILGAVVVMMMCVGLAIAFDDKQCYANCHTKCTDSETEMIAAEDNHDRGASNHHAVKRVRCNQKCHKNCGGEGGASEDLLGHHGGEENGMSCNARCFHKCMRGHHHRDENGRDDRENGNSHKKTQCYIKCHKECHGSPST